MPNGWPRGRRNIAIIGHHDIQAAVAAMKAGVCDCLEESVSEDRLKETLDRELNRYSGRAEQMLQKLTPVESHVFRLIVSGKTSKEIASQLRRSQNTIDVHRKRILRRLGVHKTIDLVKQAWETGLCAHHRPEQISDVQRASGAIRARLAVIMHREDRELATSVGVA